MSTTPRVTIAGSNAFTGRLTITTGKLRIASATPYGANSSAAAIVLGNANGSSQPVLELVNNVTITRPISDACQSGSSNPPEHLVSVSGTNTVAGLVTGISGGTDWPYKVNAGSRLIVTGRWTNSATTGGRNIWLRGEGDGEWVGAIGTSPSVAGTNNLIKDGPGSWTLWATNVYNGFTAVSNGTLFINGRLAPTKLSVNTNVYVGTGGSLAGNGAIVTPPLVLVQAGGGISPGASSNTIGTLAISNTLTLIDGCTNVFELNAGATPSNDQVAGMSLLNCAGTVKVSLLTGTLAAGQSFQLFSAAAYAGNFSAFDLPALTGGLSWDTSTLAVDGTLRIIGKDIRITQPTRTSDGNFQFGGTSMATNQAYRILATTNVANVLSWTQVGSGTFAGGIFSFTDLAATNFPARFYRVVSP